MRSDILSAHLKPGQRLKFPDICSDYKTSVGAAREVLIRLSSEGLVVPQARQGFSVVELSAAELVDLTTARAQLEGLVLEQAILHADTSWEAEVLSSHHLLSRTPMPDPADNPSAMNEWAKAHEAFHNALLSGCPSRRLREPAEKLRDEAELYRRWSGTLNRRGRDVAAEHRAIAEAAIARDVGLAVHLLRTHITRTTEILLEWEGLGEHSSAVPQQVEASLATNS